jgi:hypothetical protein
MLLVAATVGQRAVPHVTLTGVPLPIKDIPALIATRDRPVDVKDQNVIVSGSTNGVICHLQRAYRNQRFWGCHLCPAKYWQAGKSRRKIGQARKRKSKGRPRKSNSPTQARK